MAYMLLFVNKIMVETSIGLWEGWLFGMRIVEILRLALWAEVPPELR